MRIFIDTLSANARPLTICDFERLIAESHTLVVANTVIDVSAFQRAPASLSTLLKNGSLVIELWNTPAEMVKKTFYWSSCQKETHAAETLEAAIAELPNKAEILQVADLLKIYGIPKGQWQMGAWAPPANISTEDANVLGVPVTAATRSEIYLAAKKLNTPAAWDAFDRYNAGYNAGLAHQHLCDAIINSDGTFTTL